MVNKKIEKEAPSILSPNMAIGEKVLLAQTVMTPGWKIIVAMANDACAQFTQDIIKVDPEQPDAQHVVSERQRRARIASEFSDLLMRSIYAHADSIRHVDRKEEEEAVSRVAEMFGIHPAAPSDKGKPPSDAITRTFGIHPARPKSKKSPAEGK